MGRDVSDFYVDMFIQHGMTPKGVAWKDRMVQEKRWRLLLEGNHYGVATMLDVGCGYGGLVPYLNQTRKLWFNYVSYCGIDVVEQYIKAAEREYGSHQSLLNPRSFFEVDVRNWGKGNEDFMLHYDLVVCSGGLTYHDMPEKLEMLDAMWALTKQTLAFNMRTQEAYLGDIAMILPRFETSNYKILHNYGLDEMTVVVKRD